MRAAGLVLLLAFQSAETNYQLGLDHLRAGRPAEARPYLEKAAHSSPRNAEMWKALGMAASGSRDLARAEVAFGKACELAELDTEACYFHGRTLSGLGRYEDARRPLEKALRGAPPELRSRIHRAAALNFVRLTQPEEAEKHFRDAVHSHAEKVGAVEDPRVDYGAFLIRQGRAAEAMPLLEQAVKAQPDSARANGELGKALLYSGDAKAAAAALERSLALNPEAWEVRMLLGRAYLQLGRTQEAEREMRLGREGWARSAK